MELFTRPALVPPEFKTQCQDGHNLTVNTATATTVPGPFLPPCAPFSGRRGSRRDLLQKRRGGPCLAMGGDSGSAAARARWGGGGHGPWGRAQAGQGCGRRGLGDAGASAARRGLPLPGDEPLLGEAVPAPGDISPRGAGMLSPAPGRRLPPRLPAPHPGWAGRGGGTRSPPRGRVPEDAALGDADGAHRAPLAL